MPLWDGRFQSIGTLSRKLPHSIVPQRRCFSDPVTLCKKTSAGRGREQRREYVLAHRAGRRCDAISYDGGDKMRPGRSAVHAAGGG